MPCDETLHFAAIDRDKSRTSGQGLLRRMLTP
jgi:hypothetical protein